MAQTVVIDEALNGPAASANGGYACGIVARFVEGPAEVTLREPVPLGRELGISVDDDGAVTMSDGDRTVAEGRPVEAIDVAVPDPVDADTARRATAGYLGYHAPPTFRRCFVCGVDRDDALGVFAGAIEGRELVASPWVPPAWVAGEDGAVRPEFVWAVLDCPTYFATTLDGSSAVRVLGRLSAELVAPVEPGQTHVVLAWPLGSEVRKHYAGSAVMTADGELRAHARALMIELPAPPASEPDPEN